MWDILFGGIIWFAGKINYLQTLAQEKAKHYILPQNFIRDMERRLNGYEYLLHLQRT